MAWFRKAAEQGHPHSSYNLAVGHFTGIKTGTTKLTSSTQITKNYVKIEIKILNCSSDKD